MNDAANKKNLRFAERQKELINLESDESNSDDNKNIEVGPVSSPDEEQGNAESLPLTEITQKDTPLYYSEFETESVSKIMRELIMKVCNANEADIILKFFIEGKSEAIIASEKKVSRQYINKLKRSGIEKLGRNKEFINYFSS